jgi:hypothetical protein
MKRAVSTPYFLFIASCVAILASLFVLADAIGTDSPITVDALNATNDTPRIPDAPALAPLTDEQAAIVDSLAPGTMPTREIVTTNGKPTSTPLQAIKACKDKDCTTTGYLAAASTIINTTNYNCTVTDDGKVYLTCDSMYDGNGDGVCTSGESCIQFGIVGSFVTRKERNSQDAWQEHDPTYVMVRAEVAP